MPTNTFWPDDDALTLPSNVALAVHPEVDYVRAKRRYGLCFGGGIGGGNSQRRLRDL